MFYIAICDDSDNDINLISKLVFAYFNKIQYNIELYMFKTGKDLLRSNIQFDIVFMDIMINDENGIDVACQINEMFEAIIIFISSSSTYLQDGYKARAYRYFIKPIEWDLFYKEMNNIIHNLIIKKQFIKCDSNPGVKIYLKNIIYAEKIERKMIFHTVNGDFNSSLTFNYWKEYLCKYYFVYPFKGILVNLNYVNKIDKKDIILLNGERVPLSRNYKKQIEISFSDFLVGC